MQINELLTAIRNGNYDQNLDSVRQAVIDRQKAKAPRAYEFRPGQRVFFNNKVRPQYLQKLEQLAKDVPFMERAGWTWLPTMSNQYQFRKDNKVIDFSGMDLTKHESILQAAK